MSCKHTRVWIQDICKKSTVLTKKYWKNTLLSINIIIDDRLTCNVNKVYVHVYEFGGKYLSISNCNVSFNLIISKKSYFFRIEKDTIKFIY